ncbi:MAG: AtpZ/AtpI family protein [Eubacteriales bacterium]
MNKKFDYLQAFSLISQIGIVVAIPIVLGAILGNFIDNKLGTGSIASIILILLGVAIGFKSAYSLIMRVLK